MSDSRQGLTVVLIGGEMTFDSGERVDSRQPIRGDPWDFILRAAMAHSELWWLKARTLAEVLLEKDAGEAPWSLVWAPRTLLRLKQDGSRSRARIDTVLPQAVSLMDLWSNDTSGSSSTSDASKTNARYRVLEHPLRYSDLTAYHSPTVFFGIHRVIDNPAGRLPLWDVFRQWPNTVVILAHTPRFEAAVADLRSIAEGRPIISEKDTLCDIPSLAELEQAKQKFKDHQPVIVDADFKIAYFLDAGAPGSAADLDAALQFVLSRYDRKVGLWDLTRDPGLRESLLSPEDLKAVPRRPASIPTGLSIAASAAKDAREKKWRAEQQRRRHVHRNLWPVLQPLQWKIEDSRFPGSSYVLAMGEDVQWPSLKGLVSVPILYVCLHITKKEAVLMLDAPPFGLQGRAEYLLENADGLEEISGQRPDGNVKAVVCRFPGQGWSAEDTDRVKMVDTVSSIVEFLRSTVAGLRVKAEQQYAAHIKQCQLEERTLTPFGKTVCWRASTPPAMGHRRSKSGTESKVRRGFWARCRNMFGSFFILLGRLVSLPKKVGPTARQRR